MSGSVTIMPHSALGGTLTPGTVSLSVASPTATFTVTDSAGSDTITTTNDRSLINPTAPNYISSSSGDSTFYTVTGPGSGITGSASGSYTVAPSGTFSGTITVTPSGCGLSTPIVLTWSGTSDAKNFSLPAPSSAGIATLAFTNSGGLQDWSTMSYGSQSLQLVDSTWRTGNASAYGGSASDGPWFLDTANTYYKLTAALTATGTGFVFSKSNQTLDLAGYELTFDDATPLPLVPNYSFETDSLGSTTVTDWDLTLAAESTFDIVANTVYMYPSSAQLLQWSVPTSATQTGTASLTTGSAVVTGSGTNFTSALIGRFLWFQTGGPYFNGNSGPTVYKVASVQSTTQLTLDRVANAAENGSGWLIYLAQVITSNTVSGLIANQCYEASVLQTGFTFDRPVPDRHRSHRLGDRIHRHVLAPL